MNVTRKTFKIYRCEKRSHCYRRQFQYYRVGNTDSWVKNIKQKGAQDWLLADNGVQQFTDEETMAVVLRTEEAEIEDTDMDKNVSDDNRVIAEETLNTSEVKKCIPNNSLYFY